MDKKVLFKNWSKSDKTTLYFMLGCAAFFTTLAALHIQQKDTKHALFQGTCAVITASSAVKKIRNVRNGKGNEKN